MKRFASQAFYRLPDDPPAGGAPLVTDPPVENANMRQLRESREAAITAEKAATARAEAAEAKLTEAARAELAENERLKAELDDEKKRVAALSPLTDRNAALESTFTQLYDEMLATVPEDKRADAEALTSSITAPEAKFKHLKLLMPHLAPPATPTKVGSPGSPGLPGATHTHHDPPTLPDLKDADKIDLFAEMKKAAMSPGQQQGVKGA